MFAAVLVALLLAQTPSIEVEEDSIDHKKSTTLRLGQIAKAETDRLEMELLIHCDSGIGVRKPLKPDDKILLHFVSRAEHWQFLKYRNVVIADGGSSIDLGEPQHRGDIFRGGVSEQIMPRIRFADLERLATEPILKGKVGIQLFELTNDQQDWLRKFVDRLKVGEDEARKLEAADRQQEDAKKAKQRAEEKKEQERVTAIKQDWAKAREGCLKRAKAGSAKSFSKNLQRNIDKALDEVAERHGIKAIDLIAIVGNPY